MHRTATTDAIFWKTTLALIALAFLAGMAATIAAAVHRGTPVVDADYYDHGLRYGKTAAGTKNPGLHWDISATVAGADLVVRVTDRSGAPISGGSLSFEPKAGGAASAAPILWAESTAGTFRAPRPASPQGELRGTLRFTKGDAAATRKLVLID